MCERLTRSGGAALARPPCFLDAWHIDPASNYQFPFSVVFPSRSFAMASGLNTVRREPSGLKRCRDKEQK